MKERKRFVYPLTTMIAVLALTFGVTSNASENDGFFGDWLGELTTPNTTIKFAMHFSKDADNNISGTIDIQGLVGLPLTDIVIEGNTMTCVLQSPNGAANFKASLDAEAEKVSGEVIQGTNPAMPFTMVPGVVKVEYASTIIRPDKLIEAWKGMADYTVEMAEMMPEEKYDFKPVDEVRSFGEQMNHLTGSNHFFASVMFNAPLKGQVTAKSKADIIAALRKSFDEFTAALEKTTDEQWREILSNGKTRFETFLFSTDHITHTRGIVINYLRMNGMAPPQFRSY